MVDQPAAVPLARDLAGGAVTRANAAHRRQEAWHSEALKTARTPLRRLAAACAWLRAEARRADTGQVEQVTALVLGQVEALRELNRPQPTRT